jgi:polyphosphate kinase 2 (PPK2 family)
MLRTQQGIWHSKNRAIIVFEGFDAAGKGGTIRRIVEVLDPRGFHVYPIGPPTSDEQGKHYLYRFWNKLPSPGTIAIFDRSWYGRVLVERVEKLTPKKRWKEAYREIRNFEEALVDDGIDLIKIFLAINKNEQSKRFDERAHDPYKQWKLTSEDLQARKHWNKYVEAVDDLFEKTHTPNCPWNLVPSNDKHFAREESLHIVTRHLKRHSIWIEKKVKPDRS